MKNLNLKKLLKNKRVTIPVIGIFTIAILAIIVFGNSHKPTVERRHIPFSEIERFIENGDEVEVREDGTYTLTQEQFDEILLGQAKESYDEIEDKEKYIEDLKNELNKETTNDTIYKQALIEPTGGILKAGNITVNFPEGFYNETLLVTFKALNTDKESDKELSKIYSLTAQTLWGEDVSQFNKNLTILTTLTQNDKVVKTSNLSTYYFDTDSSKWEKISSNYSNGKVVALTDHFTGFVTEEGEPEEDPYTECGYTIDDKDIEPCFSAVGPWNLQTTGYGKTALYSDFVFLYGGSYASWTPKQENIAGLGPTNIEITVPNLVEDGLELPNNATYWVVNKNGIEWVSIDQKANSGGIVSLGEYEFEDTASVTFFGMNDSSSSENTITGIADAVSFGEGFNGQTDFTPPTIEDVTAVEYNGQFRIKAKITDASGIYAAYVYYNNTQYQLVKDGDYYSINIPSDPENNYYIVAYDGVQNEQIWHPTKGYISRTSFSKDLGVPPWGFYLGKDKFSLTPNPAKAGVSFCNQFCGDPINTATGNFIEEINLFNLPGNPNLELSITYNSLSGKSSIFGENWSYSLNYKLTEFITSQSREVFIEYPGGRVVRFSGDDLKADAGNFETLEKTTDGYVLTNKEATRIYFDGFGDVTKITDANENTLTFTYSEQFKNINLSKLTSVKNNGREIVLNYNDAGLVSSVNSSDKTILIEYSDQNDLIKITDAKGNPTKFEYSNNGLTKKISALGYPIYTNTYDDQSRLIKQVSGEHFTQNYSYSPLQTTVTDINGKKAVYKFNADSLMTSLTNEAGNTMYYTYDANKNVTKLTDPEGNTTKYEYDNNGNRTKEIDALGHISTFEYETNFNKITKQVLKDSTHFTNMQYDSNGNLIQVKDAYGNPASFKYNANGQVIESSDFNGNITKYSYDSLGDLVRITDPIGSSEQFSYDTFGKVIKYTNKLGAVFNYEYDKNSNLTKISGPLNFALRFEYDNNNRLIKEIDANGGEVKYSYDNSENIVSVEDQLGNKTSFTYGQMNERLEEIDALGIVTKFNYTPDYLVKSVTQAHGTDDAATTEFGYNKSKIQNVVINPQGGINKILLDPLYLVKTRFVNANNLNIQTTFTYSPTGAVVSETDPNGNVYTYKLDRIVEKKDSEGNIVKFEYDKQGNIVKVTDANGNISKFVYDGLNRLVTTTNSAGKTKLYNYDSNSNLLSETDENGVITKYKYNELDRLTERVQNYKDGEGSDTNKNITTKYEYDNHGNVVKVTDPKGHSTSFTYDKAHRNTEIVDAKGSKVVTQFDKVGNVIKITDRNGNTLSKSYDALGRVISEINAENETTKYKYDKNSNLISKTDPRGALTTYSYDGADRIIFQTNALGGITSIGYDNNSNIKSVVDENGHTTSYNYDKVNRLISEINPEGHAVSLKYDANSNLISKIDAKGNITDYKFDNLNRLIQEIDALGQVEQYEYDSTNNLTKLTDRNNNSTQFKYDSLYRQTQIIDAQGFKTAFEYDATGNIISQTDGNNHKTTLEYDELSRLINLTNAEGEKTTFGYDNEVNQTSKVDPDGVVKKLGLDKVYRLTEVVENFNVNGQINNNTNVNTKYEYDDNGNLTAVINPNGAKTTFRYDLLNRQIEEVDAENNSWKYEYDTVGNKTKRIDANNQATTYQYFNDNELAKIAYPDGSAVSYRYDANNNNIQMTDSLGVTLQNFDPLNRITNVKDSLGRNLSYNYDAVGNKKSLIYPTGETVNYGYNKNNWLNEMTTTFGSTKFERDGIGNLIKQLNANGTEADYKYDKADRVLEITNSTNNTLTTNSSFKYTYDKAGQRTKVESVYDWRKPNKVITNYSYDGLRRLIESKNNSGTYSQYEYDRAGNRTKLLSNNPAVAITGTENSPVSQTYTYNDINQVLSIIEETGKATNNKKISIDKVIQPLYALQNELEAQKGKHIENDNADELLNLVGSIIPKFEQGSLSEKEISENLNQLNSAISSLPESGIKTSLLAKVSKATDASQDKTGELKAITFNYDANGNRVNKEFSGPKGPQLQGENYNYDFENRLIGVTGYKGNNDGNIVESMLSQMRYDGMGRRLIKNDSNYVFDGLDPVSVINTNNGQFENLYRDNTQRIISSTTNSGQGFSYQYDALDNVVGLTKDKGQSNHNYRYSDFGSILPEQGNFTAPHNNFTYNNQELDPATGLYEYYSRAYDSSVGVWLQKDNYRGSILEPKSLHSYAFVHQDPIGNRDYYGYDTGAGTNTFDLVDKSTTSTSNSTGMISLPSKKNNTLKEYSYTDYLKLMEICSTIEQGSADILSNYINSVHSEQLTSNEQFLYNVGVSLFGEQWGDSFMSNYYSRREYNRIKIVDYILQGNDYSSYVKSERYKSNEDIFNEALNIDSKIYYQLLADNSTDLEVKKGLQNIANSFNSNEMNIGIIYFNPTMFANNKSNNTLNPNTDFYITPKGTAVPGDLFRSNPSMSAEAWDTTNLILKGGPYPYSRDGSTYLNKEGHKELVIEPFKEYTVTDPKYINIPYRDGPLRIISDGNGRLFYSTDHYKSLIPIKL